MLAVEPSATIASPGPAPKISITPKQQSYVVVLGASGVPPASFPVLEFEIVGPPLHAVDVQVSRDPALLAGGPGLPGSWNKSEDPGLRMKQFAFSSWSNGDTEVILDASGKATYPLPLDWWRDLARLPRKEFGTATLHYRAVASPTPGATPAAWSAKSGASAGKVLVHSNLVNFVVTTTYLDTDATKSANMTYTVREPGTTDMYTLVQWKKGSSVQWPNKKYSIATDYGIEHLLNHPDWAIDQVRMDPRYVDSVDVANGDGYFISPDQRSATTNDTPGGSIQPKAKISHSFYSLDFETRVHLNFEVPPTVTIVKQEGIALQDAQGIIYELVQAEIADPQPFIIDRAAWNARILQVRNPDGTVTVTHPNSFAGP
jgi:hypothetical protein